MQDPLRRFLSIFDASGGTVVEQQRAAIATIDDYIRQFPPAVRAKLQQIRAAIRAAAPAAEERISYRMPTFRQDGNLVHFAAFKNHIGFFPAGEVMEDALPETARYRTSKGTLHFPLDRPIPTTLIRKIVLYRIEENRSRRQKRRAAPAHPERARGGRTR